MEVTAEIVNVFIANGEGGNPAGIVLDASNLSAKQMQSVAHQIGASETAFMLSDKDATRKLRFFTPTVEVPLCGHATIATWWLLHHLGLQESGNYTQNTDDGVIGISIEQDGKVFMEQPLQEMRDFVDSQVAADCLAISPDDLSPNLKPRLVQRQLMVELKSLDVLNSLNPDLELIERTSNKYDFYGLHVFVLLDEGKTIATVRNFCPRVGINEDAATGTANGSFLEFLRHSGQLPEQSIYKIEQGMALGKPSHIFGKFVNNKVWIGGIAKQMAQLELKV
jgi:PhzF family phenazine biosynthesis protein